MEANPKKIRGANFAGAQALENFLLTFGRDGAGNHPLFFPMAAANGVLRAP
jgi:hypothetical protein